MLNNGIIKTSVRVEEYIHTFLTVVGDSSQCDAWRAHRHDHDAVEKRQYRGVPRIELIMSVFAGSKLVIALSHSHVQIPVLFVHSTGS
jgi:hypothetical protein